MIKRKNLYYIVKDGTKIIYKGKNKKKADMLESSLVAKETAQEKASYGRCYY